MTENKNSVGSNKLSFLDDIYLELRDNDMVRVGLTKDVIDGHLSYFRIFKINTRKD